MIPAIAMYNQQFNKTSVMWADMSAGSGGHLDL